ncbi:hypothetical protein TWF481_000118 [Arthrobotrys musiformis]|uniref:Peptidase C14 caspase domain-containing protein n=1 Tax=Arthrobotrys musiformis TaxID=47236 RepID=A0AAV9WNN7_9PEZI
MNRGHKIWALLIGVESYFEGKERPIEYPRLNGCVRDVEAVAKYLRQQGAQNIKTLTASNSRDGGPIESHTDLPIYENIERELHHITENSQAGDIVYIHYSGHGIRRSVLGQYNGADGDTITGTALALADVMRGGAYLTGYQLGVFIKGMVKKKGLRVTLVLDSCFSGQGLRSSKKYTPRTILGQSDNSMLQSDQIADDRAASTDLSLQPASRGTHVKRSWLSNPTGCTILTACQFDEAAGEDKFPGTDGAHGVLTYWMLKALTEGSRIMRPTHAKIKDYVQSKIMRMRPTLQQSPVLHGDGDYIFIGNEIVVERPACHINSRYQDEIELDIGKAQGVSVGAVYHVYTEALGAGIVNLSRLQAHIVETPDDSIFRSVAQISVKDLQEGEDPGRVYMEVGKGSTAVLQTWGLPSDVYVQVTLPDNYMQEFYLEGLRAELEQTPGIFLQTEGDAFDEPFFTVTTNDFNELEIRREGKPVPRIPIVSIEDREWIQKLSFLICHLARFEALSRQQTEFVTEPLPPHWFTFTAKAKGLEPIRECEEAYHVKGGQKLIVSFQLNDSCPLESAYVSFYTFSSAWGIHKIHPGPGQNSTKLSKRRVERFGIGVDPPPSTGEYLGEIQDTIRAFICTSDISWEELMLPDLPLEDLSIPENRINEVTVATRETMATKDRNISTRSRITEENFPRNVSSFALEEEALGVLDLTIKTIQ